MHYAKAQDNVVGVATRLWTGPSGVRIAAGARDFSLLLSPNQLWGPSTLLFNVQGMKFTAQLHLVPRSRTKLTAPLYAFMAWFFIIDYICAGQALRT